MKELIGHYVAYRKLVSPPQTDLLAEEQFRLYAVCARFPHNLSGQVPWQQRQQGVYDCQWGTDIVRVVVAGQLPQQAHNAPLHLFSASNQLLDFARGAYQRRSIRTSLMLNLLFKNLQGEGFRMTFSVEEFERQYLKERFAKLASEEQRELLQTLTPQELQELFQALPAEAWQVVYQALSPEDYLARLSDEQIQEYLDQRKRAKSNQPGKPRRKK
jgi:hypothetical protein